jgi:hypothetical protein
MRSTYPVNGVWINWNVTYVRKNTNYAAHSVLLLSTDYLSNYFTPEYPRMYELYSDKKFFKARPSEIQNFTKSWSELIVIIIIH